MQNIKLKISLLVIAIVCVLTLFGVSVWAVVTQTVDIQTYITVSDDGQAKCEVTIADYVAPSNNSTLSSLSEQPSFTQALYKSVDQDYAQGEFNSDVEFSYKNYYRYFLVQIQINNHSTVPINYSLSIIDQNQENFVFSYPIEASFFTNTSQDGFALAQTSGSGQIAVSGSATVYLGIYVVDGFNLWDLPSISAQNFNLAVEVSV